MTSRERFLDLMKREILKLDLAELDFGIYRILNYRRTEIERFFDEELPELLDKVMSHEGEARRGELEARLEALRADLESAAGDLGLSSAFVDSELRPELSSMPKGVAFTETREALARLESGPVFGESEEDRLYNALYTFFSRYYRDGDFQPQQRRAREARYSVPYNGEDVHFHWRSKGSHYVKTTEELKSYAFRSGDWRVRFELVEAFQEPDNVKGNTRYFIPVPEECRTEIEDVDRLFVVPFAFRRLTADEEKRYGKKREDLEGDTTQERIINELATEIDPPSGVTEQDLLYHLRRYSRKNRTDYFVHPQLGAFLRDELDYYLKNEFLDIEGLTTSEAMADRLAKLRVLREVAGRIIDILDEIESFQARLFVKRRFVLSSDFCVTTDRLPNSLYSTVLANQAQLDEWRQLFGVVVSSQADLDANPSLVIDTRYFSGEFKRSLLGSFDNLDAQIDGIAIHADAYHGLRLLADSYLGQVRCSYIDPPFNTETDQFAYLDRYRSSTWLTLVSERIRVASSFLSDSGTIYVHLDHNSNYLIRQVLDELFGADLLLNEVIWRIGWVSGYKASADRYVRNHETLYVYTKSDKYYFDKQTAQIPYHSFAEDTIKDELGLIAGAWGFELRDRGPIKIVLKDRLGEVWKLGLTTKDGRYNVEDTWNANEYEELHSNKIKRNAAEYTPNGSEITQKPEQLLARIIGVSSAKGDFILDFFAGTGTTAAVAKKMGRRFIAVEAADYFETDLLWRLKQVLFGKQVGVSGQVGHQAGGMFQYLKLESYEDSLNSLTVDEEGGLGDRQRIRYVLPNSVHTSACLLATEKLEEPFDYQLEVHTEEGVRFVDVDLVTTFNLMKGIRPRRYRELDDGGRRYVLVEGEDEGETVLVVWRSVVGLDPEGERVFLAEAVQEALGTALGDYNRVYHNADSALPNSVSLDAEFKRLMFEPETGLS